MADPRSVVPYHDPYDSPIDYEHLNFMNDANPSLAGLSSDNEPTPAIPESFSGSANANANILDPNNPYEDPMAWNFYYENLRVQSHEAGPSHQNQGQSSFGPIPYAPFPNASFPNASFPDGQTSNASGRSEEIFLDGRNIAVWPPEPVPFQCTCCQVLREIIHTDGVFYIAFLSLFFFFFFSCKVYLFLWWQETILQNLRYMGEWVSSVMLFLRTGIMSRQFILNIICLSKFY